MRRRLPRYELWVGEEHKEHTIVEIFAEKLGEYKDDGGESGLIYRVYRKADGGIIIHLYYWSNVPGKGDCASIFEYDDLETAAQRGFRPVLKKMNLI